MDTLILSTTTVFGDHPDLNAKIISTTLFIGRLSDKVIVTFQN